MITKLPLGSMAVKLTGTPVASVGIGPCWNRCLIHSVWSASEIAGVPLSEKSSLSLVLSLPEGVWSVTVPVIVMLLPSNREDWDAETVVALEPRPKQ